MMQKRC